jgi:hypothetical protein
MYGPKNRQGRLPSRWYCLKFTVDEKILDFKPENGEFALGLDHVDKGRRTGGVGVKIN